MKLTTYLVLLIASLTCCNQKKELPNLPTDGIAQFYDSIKWPFYHGVASGDPLQTKVIIWTRVTPKDSLEKISVRWEFAKDSLFNEIINQGLTTTSPARDYTVKVDVNHLKAGSSYFYRFNALNMASPVGKTKTAPRNHVSEVSFAVASCANYEFGSFSSYKAIANAKNIDAVIHLGDYIYEYAPGSYGDSTTGRFHFPPKEVITLDEYRLRYSQYRLDSNLAAAHQNHPFITIWDDHEIANNSYKYGAQNHQENEGDYATRINGAKQAYYEWLPVRESEELYRSFSYGKLVDLIMLDERLAGRTAPPDSITDPKINEGKMLGDKQLAWFIDQLKTSDAQWKVVGNQVIFSYLNWGHASFNINLDSWDGYPGEREKIKSAVLEREIENVIFVTGDTHSAWAFEVTDRPFDEGSDKPFAVEFGTTSINSGNSNERFPTDSVLLHEQKIVNSSINPHLKYANLRDHGFLTLTLSPADATALWKFVSLNGPPGVVSGMHEMKVNDGEVNLLNK